MNNITELKNKIAKLEKGERADVTYVVREKISEPHGSGNWTVSVSLMIEKDRSFPLGKEKYYFISVMFNDSITVISHMLKAIGKSYKEQYNDFYDFRQGYTLDEIYTMLDYLQKESIQPDKNKSTYTEYVYGHYIFKDDADKKCEELCRPHKIVKLKERIKTIETDFKNLYKLKSELHELENNI